MKMGLLPLVIYDIFGPFYAAFYCFIAYIYSIKSILWEIWLIGSVAYPTLTLYRFDLPCRSCLKWIFSVAISSFMRCKSSAGKIFPFSFIIGLSVECLVIVVINNYFVLLPIAFTGRNHYSSSIFQHWE